METFYVLADPVRQRILEFLTEGEQTSGNIAKFVIGEFGISQPAVSQHLKVLRDHYFASVKVNGQKRVYNINPKPFENIDGWLDKFRRFWEEKFDALSEEIDRGKRK